MSEQTPGPWYVSPAGIVAAKGVGNIAKLAGASLEGDADLIAAAPELLLAVESTVRQMEMMLLTQAAREDWVYPIEEALKGLKAVVAKAHGEKVSA